MEIDLTVEQRFWEHTDKSSQHNGCWLWKKSRSRTGYGHFCGTYAHRISYCIAKNLNTEDIASFYIIHSCDNPPCVNPAHLQAGTQYENMHQMLARGRHRTPKGEACHFSKLKVAQVKQIKKKLRAGKSSVALATEFGISLRTIQCIKQGKYWKDVA